VLFITRRFPPSVGGMETLAADVDRVLREVSAVELVALRSSSVLHLAWFLPSALVRTALAVIRGRVTHVLCGDAITWAAVAPATRVRRTKSVVMVHGLDLLAPNALYQAWIHWALPKADRIVANSAATAAAVRDHGVEPQRIVIVNPGVGPNVVTQADRAAARNELVQRLNIESSSLVVLTLGRLVRRKGVAWFIETVLPRTPKDVTYVIAGDGPMREHIEAAIQQSRVAPRVHLLGRVDDDCRELLLRGADVCLMPNVRVPGDMEGFGLVAVEASTRGTLVVASGLEGIVDAVVDQETGIIVQPEDADELTRVITSLAGDRDAISALASRYQQQANILFSAERMARQLVSAVGLDATDARPNQPA
jgi:phosphatidyl-myo-inositol dimannoside synthase